MIPKRFLTILGILLIVGTGCSALQKERSSVLETIEPIEVNVEDFEMYEPVTIKIPDKRDTKEILSGVNVIEVPERGKLIVISPKALKELTKVIEDGNYSIEQLELLTERYNNLIEIANKQQIQIFLLKQTAENLRQAAVILEGLADKYKGQILEEKVRSTLTTIFAILSLALTAL